MMTVKSKLATCLRIILTLNKLTIILENYLHQFLLTSLKLVKIKKRKGQCKKKKGLSTVNKKDFRNANNTQNITMMDFEKLIIYVQCKF